MHPTSPQSTAHRRSGLADSPPPAPIRRRFHVTLFSALLGAAHFPGNIPPAKSSTTASMSSSESAKPVEFYNRIGVADRSRWYDEMTPLNRRPHPYDEVLPPAPLHTAPSFLNFSFLSAADKLHQRALAPLTLTEQRDTGHSLALARPAWPNKKCRRTLRAPSW